MPLLFKALSKQDPHLVFVDQNKLKDAKKALKIKPESAVNPAQAKQLGERLKAKYMIYGDVYPNQKNQNLMLSIHLLDIQKGLIIWHKKFPVAS